MRQCPSRVHNVCLRFPNLSLRKNLSPNDLDDLSRAPLELPIVYQKVTKESVGKCHGKWAVQDFLALLPEMPYNIQKHGAGGSTHGEGN